MPKPNLTTLVVMGEGESSATNTAELLDDYLGETEAVHFVLPVSKAAWTASVKGIADFADANGYPYEVVVEGSVPKSAKQVVDEAVRKTKVADLYGKLVSMAKKRDGILLVLWDDDDEALVDALEDVLDDVEALDLTTGLDRLEFVDEGDESESDDDEDDDEFEDVEEDDGQDEPEPEDESDDGEEEVDDEDDDTSYSHLTEEELETWSFAELKAFAKEHDIDVPNRTRSPGYRSRILDWAKDQDGSDPKPQRKAAAEEAPVKPKKDHVHATVESTPQEAVAQEAVEYTQTLESNGLSRYPTQLNVSVNVELHVDSEMAKDIDHLKKVLDVVSRL